uniref:Kinesin motor domain-containing protein n=1 Tax=Callorhinchus milii TaxID=7868 RepID=A0A4W3I835_CALMI
MMGSKLSPGIIPLTVHKLFKVIEGVPNREFLLRVSYMEIYNENVTDLLVKQKGKPLEIREDIQVSIHYLHSVLLSFSLPHLSLPLPPPAPA